MHPSSASNPFVVIMIIIILILALAIILLAHTLTGVAAVYSEKPDEDEEHGNDGAAASSTGSAASATTPAAPSAGSAAIPAALLTGLLLLAAQLITTPGYAKDADNTATTAAAADGGTVSGLSDTAFYMINGVVFTELLVIVVLLFNLKLLLNLKKKEAPSAALDPAAAEAAAAARKAAHISWWAKINRFKPAAQEADLDLGHDYDGIRELDNNLPPWWLYGFYCTILFAIVYLWRFHVSHTAPLSGEEYQLAVQAAETEKAAYLKNAANNVDETTVKLLVAEPDLAAGKAVFESTCFACHGKQGEGGVGPNLTDDYWLHGGSIQSVFKTIKYGWPEKGMKSWKDDYSPVQIAQIASYVESLRGTRPANPIAPQGTLEATDTSKAH